MHVIKFHQLQGAVTIEGIDRDDVSFDIGEITSDETIEVRMGALVNENLHEFQLNLDLDQAEAVLITLQRSINYLRMKKLDKTIKKE